jgi:hypothetical protein
MNKETKKGLKVGFGIVGAIIICALVDTFASPMVSLIFFGTLLSLAFLASLILIKHKDKG